ncbi:redoxin domain-containing protein [Maribellus comscasis]|uniref:Redoxin domain-containing protein n=1 Tax=Maribellus comscasis TaxID=2681766 RepID=A0A6I6JQS5_9BACT|nr:redoxin domain-containing protein [Maribellus comscasis]QGY43529.1 redoxin domain-containing protein [Maribellus comscasis]
MRKFYKGIIIAIISVIGGFLTYQVIEDYSEKKEVEKQTQILPDASFNSLSGIPVNLHDFNQTQPLVIIYFHPECEHCQYEAQEIGQNAYAFNHCQLVMVTPDDSLQRVENFCSDYHLWELDNCEVLLDTKNRFQKVFGKAIIPSVYIYATNRKLITHFLGETKSEAIINATNNTFTKH